MTSWMTDLDIPLRSRKARGSLENLLLETTGFKPKARSVGFSMFLLSPLN